MLHARLGEPRRALDVGDDQLRLAVLDPRGQFAALPPAVEQSGAAARHQYAEIGNAPRIGVAHREADAVAALADETFDQPRRDLPRRPIDLADRQTLAPFDQQGPNPMTPDK